MAKTLINKIIIAGKEYTVEEIEKLAAENRLTVTSPKPGRPVPPPKPKPGPPAFEISPNQARAIVYMNAAPRDGAITLTIKETNVGTGKSPLTNPYVILTNTVGMHIKLDKMSPYYIGGDINDNGVLDNGETWEWRVTAVANAKYTAVGHGISPTTVDITYPPYDAQLAQITIR
jgi:hypothetical protein